MKTIKINENWNDLIDRLKHKFVFLTNNDLRFEEDKKEEMFEGLQIKLGKSKEELHKIITTL